MSQTKGRDKPMMTLEEMEAKILARVQDGRGQANDNSGCTYRGRDGVPCVVGCLIPDEHYNVRMEGATIHNLIVKGGKYVADLGSAAGPAPIALANALNKSGIPATVTALRFLVRWQRSHDYRDNWEGKKYVGPTHSLIEQEG
jgi:hypothetical protein